MTADGPSVTVAGAIKNVGPPQKAVVADGKVYAFLQRHEAMISVAD
jgi:hypothetical protein